MKSAGYRYILPYDYILRIYLCKCIICLITYKHGMPNTFTYLLFSSPSPSPSPHPHTLWPSSRWGLYGMSFALSLLTDWKERDLWVKVGQGFDPGDLSPFYCLWGWQLYEEKVCKEWHLSFPQGIYSGVILSGQWVISRTQHWQKAVEWYCGQLHGIYQNL